MDYVDLDGKGKLNPERKKKLLIAAVIAVAVLLIIIIVVAVVVSRDHKKDNDDNNNVPKDDKLASQMKIEHLMGHLEALQTIANVHGGSRAVEFGYNDSALYIWDMLKLSTDYKVWFEYFDMQIEKSLATPQFAQTFPKNITFKPNVDFVDFGWLNGNVSVDAPVAAVPNLGCNASDWERFPANSIAVVSRGVCEFGVKAKLAIAAQAAGVIIYNQCNTPDRCGLFQGALNIISTIPVFAVSYELGISFTEVAETRLHLSASGQVFNTTTMNVLADTPFGSDESVIVVGSHLDSVPAGPGINDNGSGSATNLELALRLFALKKKTTNKIRFAWWSGEERGLLGSKYYVHHLNETDPTALRNIAMNINLDMVGSPNFMRGVYNGSDANKPETPVPADVVTACTKIEHLFTNVFAEENLSTKLTDFSGRSDYGPFLHSALIPAGGLFTGAEEVKSMAERTAFGGLANTPYDPCYHQSCDTVQNIDQTVLLQNAVAVAKVLESVANQPNLHQWLRQ